MRQGKKIGVTGDARIIHPFQDPGGSATALREPNPADLTLVDEAQARTLVEKEIAAQGDHPHDPWTPVVTQVDRFEHGWIVYYGAAEPDVMLAGNAPYLVDERSGVVVATGTAKPVEFYVNNYLHPGDPHVG